MTRRVASFIAKRWSVPRALFRVEMQSLRGGLEATVVCVRISSHSPSGSMPAQLVIKTLSSERAREADVYDVLWRHLGAPPTIRVLGRACHGPNTYLFLEHAEQVSTWPWSDSEYAAAVCRELARFHECDLPVETFRWDYESELSCSAVETLATAKKARDSSGKRLWRRLGDLRRVVAALPHIREQLLSSETRVIHGDVHPGNVIVRDVHLSPRVVLIDWARARVGSPMEDVACWLHALGCWEPEARRRHDTLIRAYLEARGTPRVFSPQLRALYWLASASNGLSGAIRYHLVVLSDSASSEAARYDSNRALIAWERVVRRAGALLRVRRS